MTPAHSDTNNIVNVKKGGAGNYDLAIIGSGPAGYVAALYAAGRKLKTCVIEKGPAGGTCLNNGCIPTKVMLNSASIISKIKDAGIHGIKIDGYSVDFPAICARKIDVVKKLGAGIETLFRAKGVELVRGTARMSAGGKVVVEGAGGIQAEHTIIAVGSRPAPIKGMEVDEKDVLSSDGALSLKKLPESIAIIGGGVIGCEFASLFNALGSRVVLLEALDRLISSQSKEASRKLEQIFKKRGIEVFTGVAVDSIRRKPELSLNMKDGKIIKAEKILVSVGRTASIDGLGLQEAGINVRDNMIETDEYLKTSAGNVFAAGDCVEGPLLAQKASYDGILACDNILGQKRKKDYLNIPGCIYTDPEIASVGLSEEEAKARDPEARTAKFSYLASGKAFLMSRTEGYIKITGDRDGRIAGAEIMGEGACDLIGELVTARTLSIRIKDLATVVHGHPTLSEIIQEAARSFSGSAIHGI